MKERFLSAIASLGKLGVVTLFAVSLSGCGIYSFTGASIPPEAKTFSVAHFPDMAGASHPSLAGLFTEELKDIFLKQTKLTLVQSDGDFAFEGQITGYTHGGTAITADDYAAMERLTITVRVSFKNRYDEATSFDKSFSQYAEYSTTTNFQSAEPGMIEEIVEKLVEDIFNAAAANW